MTEETQLRSQHFHKTRMNSCPSHLLHSMRHSPPVDHVSAQFVGHNGLSPIRTSSDENNNIAWSSSSSRSCRHVDGTQTMDTRQWTNIRPLPMDYPLERSAITLHIPLETISFRISHFMRINSIFCTYHSDHVDCVTMGLVKFVVQLWQQQPEEILMEIQRRRGCAIEMQRIRYGLVQAVTTTAGTTTPVDAAHMVVSCERMRFFRDVKCCAFQNADESRQRCYTDALRITMRLQQSDLYDQKRLGLESMIALTNLSVVSIADTLSLCRALVYGEGVNAECLRLALLPYFVGVERGSESLAFVTQSFSGSNENRDDDVQGSHFGEMHTLALHVLANALEVVTEHHDNHFIASVELDVQSPFWRHACHALVYDIEKAKNRPSEASLSAKCLYLTAQLAPQICGFPIIQDLLPVLIEANEYGKACHLSLEKESQRLMGRVAEAK